MLMPRSKFEKTLPVRAFSNTSNYSFLKYHHFIAYRKKVRQLARRSAEEAFDWSGRFRIWRFYTFISYVFVHLQPAAILIRCISIQVQFVVYLAKLLGPCVRVFLSRVMCISSRDAWHGCDTSFVNPVTHFFSFIHRHVKEILNKP